MKEKLLEVGDYAIDVGHISNFKYEHRVGVTAAGQPVYETDYLCIFRVRFVDVWTVYFRHVPAPEWLKHNGKNKQARYLLEDLQHATEVFSFRKVEPV